MDKQGRPMWF